MARNGITSRERVCVTCESPSPGPIKLLCYRWRLHGPFFPLLERLKTEDNAKAFVNGRVPVCTSCANYLQRQWNDYERKSISLPVEKRTYSLFSDMRWEKLNRKKQLDEARRKVVEKGQEMSNYEENDNPIRDEGKTFYKSKLPIPRKSKIPRLARPRTEYDFDNGLNGRHDRSLAIAEAGSRSEQDLDVATIIADRQKGKVVRKMAEMKFQDELDYIQRKVQKTMTMVHFKGREERIREIEEDLKEKIGEDLVAHGDHGNDERSTTMVTMPLDSSTQDSIGELKGHIDREMTIQRQEMAKLRVSIKADIAQAMDENYTRNEDLWNFIIEMNEEHRSGRHTRRNHPHRDGAYLGNPLRAKKRLPKQNKMSDGTGGKDSDDVEYSG